ncbi:MAG: hypothetical protein AAF806_12080 [Bacteroidota bacterium]
MKYLGIIALISTLIYSCTNKVEQDHIYVPQRVDSTIEKVVEIPPKLEEEPIVNPITREQITAIVPPSWLIVEYNEGEEIVHDDFNKDGFEDVAFLVEFRGDTTYEYSEETMLIIAVSDQYGQLEKVAISGNLGGESIGYQDQKHLWSKSGVLSYLHQSMRHHVELKYRYDRIEDQYVLIGKEFRDYGGMSAPPRSVSINYLTGKKIIREQTWDLEKEELVPLAEEMEQFEAFQLPLSMLDWESIYGSL